MKPRSRKQRKRDFLRFCHYNGVLPVKMVACNHAWASMAEIVKKLVSPNLQADEAVKAVGIQLHLDREEDHHYDRAEVKMQIGSYDHNGEQRYE